MLFIHAAGWGKMVSDGTMYPRKLMAVEPENYPLEKGETSTRWASSPVKK